MNYYADDREFDLEEQVRRETREAYLYDQPRFACTYCGKQHMSRTGLGNDIACCGEVGHVQQVPQ